MTGSFFGFARFSKAARIITFLVLTGVLITHAHGQSPDPARSTDAASSASSGRSVEIEKTKMLIPDIPVFNQRGEQVRLYTDLIKDKVVFLSFFYTRCTYICPTQGDILSKLQVLLGDRLGKEVFFISISMDPQTDSPDRLRHWSNAMSAKPGWTLLSSNSTEMRKMITDFTGDYPGPQEVHSSVIFAGNDRIGKWITVDGLSAPKGLVKLIDRLISDANRP